MGVNGDTLIRITNTAGRKVNISMFKNGVEGNNNNNNNNKRRKLRPVRIGLDISNWIARAAHGNGAMLVDERHLTNHGRAQLERGEETELDLLTSEENRQNYIRICTQKVLQQVISLQYNSKGDVMVVFDGASPPIKKQETLKRRQRKRNAEVERDAKVDNDKVTLDRRIRSAKVAGAGAAHPFIVAELIQLFRENEITFMVAPYEADGQLAYLAKCGIIDLVMTEDSDLLCHEIPAIIFKYNDWDGEGILIQRQDLGAMELQSKSLSLLDFTTTMIAIMFVCIGGDYCDSLKGIGSVSARNIVQESFLESQKSEVPVLRHVFDKLYDHSRSSLTDEEKLQYEASFMAALFAYQHPVVFCPLKQKCILANKPPDLTDPLLLDYEPYEALCHDPQRQHDLLGAFPESRFQIAITEGWIDPRSLQPYPDQIIPAHVRVMFSATRNSAVEEDDQLSIREEERKLSALEDPETQPGEDDFDSYMPDTQQYAAENTQEAPSEYYDTLPDTQGQMDSESNDIDMERDDCLVFETQEHQTQQSEAASPQLLQWNANLRLHWESTQATQPTSQNSDEVVDITIDISAPHPPAALDPPSRNALKSPHPSTQSSRTTLGSSSASREPTQSTQASMSPALLP